MWDPKSSMEGGGSLSFHYTPLYALKRKQAQNVSSAAQFSTNTAQLKQILGPKSQMSGDCSFTSTFFGVL